MVEKAKTLYDEIEEKKNFKKLSKKEQEKKERENEKKERNLAKIIRKAREKYNEYQMELRQNIITQEEFIKKRNELKKKYSEAFSKPEKSVKDFDVDITLNEFKNNLQKYKNTLLLENSNKIKQFGRNITFKEIAKDYLLNDEILINKKYEIYLYLFNEQKLFIPGDDYIIGQDENEDFINIIVDIHNEKDLSFYKLLKEKEIEKEHNFVVPKEDE
jgi:hypothetical protein